MNLPAVEDEEGEGDGEEEWRYLKKSFGNRGVNRYWKMKLSLSSFDDALIVLCSQVINFTYKKQIW